MSIEEIYVKEFYNSFAHEFDKSCSGAWECVENFLDKIHTNSIISEIGCGSGANMECKPDCEFYGCDFCNEMVNICLNKGLNVIKGDILNIPYKDNFFDYTICTAVIHHLSTYDKQKKAVSELLRITKKGGEILILVMSLKHPPNSNIKSTEQEQYINWKDVNENILGKRYYHVFTKNELKKLVPDNAIIIDQFYKLGNYGIILQKR